jgi:hypothetical protein
LKTRGVEILLPSRERYGFSTHSEALVNIFLFFGGTRVRHKLLGEGHFHCSACDRAARYERRQLGNWVHLYWVPLFRVRDLGEVIVCQSCGSTFADMQGSPLPAVATGTWTCECGNVNSRERPRCLRCGGTQ